MTEPQPTPPNQGRDPIMTPQEAVLTLDTLGRFVEGALGRRYAEYQEAVKVLTPQVLAQKLEAPLQEGEAFTSLALWANKVTVIINQLLKEQAQTKLFLNDSIE